MRRAWGKAPSEDIIPAAYRNIAGDEEFSADVFLNSVDARAERQPWRPLAVACVVRGRRDRRVRDPIWGREH